MSKARFADTLEDSMLCPLPGCEFTTSFEVIIVKHMIKVHAIDPYTIVQDACKYLQLAYRDKQRVPVELQEAFMTLWQAQSAMVLRCDWNHPAARAHMLRTINR